MFSNIDELVAGGVIGFREALEAALIVGILVALLQRTDRGAMVCWVWGGVISAVVASVVTWKAFFHVSGEFAKYELFEGLLYIIAAVLITSVVLQIFGHETRSIIERKAEAAIARREGITRARVTQVLGMLRLAPEIQQHILSMPKTAGRPTISERTLRSITMLEDSTSNSKPSQTSCRAPSRSNSVPDGWAGDRLGVE